MKTLKLKKDVVSRLDREQSAMVKGGADTTVIQQTKVCALTKQCDVQIVIVGISIGRITLFKSCHLLAPSIFAASISSPGIF